MKKVTIDLFSISELDKEAKRKAIEEHKAFLIESYQDGDYDESFNMTRSKYAKQLTKSEIIENIEINGYLYFSDGSMARTVKYCGKHERAGEHVFIFKNVEYNI